MAIFESTRRLTAFCQLFGVIPFSYSKRSKKWQKSSVLITWTVLLFTCLLFPTIQSFGQKRMPTSDELANITDKLVFALIRIQWIYIVGEALLKRNQHVAFLNLIEELEAMFKAKERPSLRSQQLNQISNRQLIRLFLGSGN